MKIKLSFIILSLVCLFTVQKTIAQVLAVDDVAYAISEILTPVNVLKNDTYPCATPTLTIISQPANGTVSINGDMTISYISDTGFTGADMLSYQINCDGNTSTANITLQVSGKPDNIINSDCYVNPVESETLSIMEHSNYGSSRVHSMTTPLVANLTGDGPEIIVPRLKSNSEAFGCNGLVIVNVKKNTVREVNTVNFASHGQSIAIADVDGDGKCEIFIQSANDSKIYCYNPDGASKSGFAVTPSTNEHYIIQLADLNGDGNAELIAGPYIFDAKTGALLLRMLFEAGGTGYGNPHRLGKSVNLAYDGCYFMPAIGDVDGDGYQEVVAGSIIYKPAADFSGYTTIRANTTDIPEAFNGYMDGPTVLADFDNDGLLDVCVIGYQSLSATSQVRVQFYVWSPSTKKIIACSPSWASNGYISIPCVGDLDNNGYPDFVFNQQGTGVGMTSYQYDTTQPGNIKQRSIVSNLSETVGLTMFDFNQDGKADIVCRNDKNLYIKSLKEDGSSYKDLITPIIAYSGTVAEYPIVADVDEDGQAEIILTRAFAPWNGSNLQGMVSIYKTGDPAKPWPSARKVWNQWPYNGTNINEDMTVTRHPVSPAAIFSNNKQPYNNFLVQGAIINQNGDVFVQIPNATPGVMDFTHNAPADMLTITINVFNQGQSVLTTPVYASLYSEICLPENLIETGSSAANVNPGEFTPITITVNNAAALMSATTAFAIRVNDNGANYPVQPECDDTDNIINFNVHSIEILYSEGATTDPEPGVYYVLENNDFSFTTPYFENNLFRAKAEGVNSGDEEELVGELIDGNAYYKYTISQITEPWKIMLEKDLTLGIFGDYKINKSSVWVGENTLYINTDADASAYIYSVVGSLYKQLDLKAGKTKEPMNKGIYIVVIADKYYKVIVK
ncbi:FG-GAP-like repeat-containing protein [Dysgonomonas sp. 520]|uniref:FG-GAP-like repeat-containing protein n=1 Tax=Dysgonomonas sp. 520 TaxID=2302931 RepID=UPI0013D077B4|nr:FG-GAP-like repeat-containing protein [Dysgonomonas sp. 520]NDW08750.1 VCBS repeat-containing protein [Dysgonomonas sp. 520]